MTPFESVAAITIWFMGQDRRYPCSVLLNLEPLPIQRRTIQPDRSGNWILGFPMHS